MSLDRRADRDTLIDDLTFADLMRLAIEEIPGASNGDWTLHGAVDPGIAILDVIAYQFEQRLYMGDQLTEPVVRASLRLLGLEEPRPVGVARTVFSFIEPPLASLGTGSVMGLVGDDLGRRFSLLGPVSVIPNLTAHATNGARIAGDEVTITVTAPPSAPGSVSLLLHVDAPPGVAPSWLATPDADAVHPAASLAWAARGADGSTSRISVDDQTLGFRRVGLLTFDWPSTWDAVGAGDRSLVARLVDGEHTEAITLRSVAANAAVAEHRVAQDHVVDPSRLEAMLALPQQRITLRREAAGALLDGPEDLVVDMTELDGATHRWRGVRSWVGVGPADRVVLIDRRRGAIIFGDGLRGRIPRPASAGPTNVRYHLGGGTDGDVAPARDWAEVDGAATARNVFGASGAEPETLARALDRSADSLAAVGRTVTEADVVAIALATPGVGVDRAHASTGYHPDFPCDIVPGAISVTVVPYARRQTPSENWSPAPMPDSGLLAAVQAGLDRGRLLGQELFVLAPTYHSVDVRLEIGGARRDRSVETAIDDVLRRHMDSLVGGREGLGWPFGDPVRPSGLVGVVQDLLGPESTVMGVTTSLADGSTSDCGDLEIGPRDLIHLGDLTIRWLDELPSGGGLR